MTAQPAPHDDPLSVFEHERRHLLAVAFRLLGSESEAQDVVQEAAIRCINGDLSQVRNVPAWLTTVVTRLCLDALRRRREIPLSEGAFHQPADNRTNPEEVAVLASELTDAFTLVLDALTPPQRVALILHDVFGTPFEESAHVLETTSDSAKKLASRARLRIRQHDITRSLLSLLMAVAVPGAFGASTTLGATSEGVTDEWQSFSAAAPCGARAQLAANVRAPGLQRVLPTFGHTHERFPVHR